MSDKLDELKKEATELGIEFSDRIGEAKLQERIDEYYASQETSGKELLAQVAAKEKSEGKSAVKGKKTLGEKIRDARAAAEKTRVITIVDNDQRINNKTTSCTVNCSNAYFDLGQIVLPLNTPVEVRQGHINALKELKIPQHVEVRTGNTIGRVEMRNRYNISYEDLK